MDGVTTLSIGPWTLLGELRRDEGPGPVLETADRTLQLGFEQDGLIAALADGEMHLTPLLASALARWSFVAVRHHEGFVEFHVDGRLIDAWAMSTPPAAEFRLFPRAAGAVRHLAVYDYLVPDADLDRHRTFLNRQQDRPYVKLGNPSRLHEA